MTPSTELMNNLDQIYNQALEMLKKGHSKQEVLLKFDQDQNELAPLLDISSVLLSVPKNIVPTPLMRKKYASAPVKSFWLAWLHVSKFAGASIGAMLLISAFSVTAYQASKSTPGKALFSLRQGEENLRLVLAGSQSQKASLRVDIAQQRLNDAKEIFNDPKSNEQQKTAAITALSEQTTSAIAEVNTAAKADPKSAVNHPLLNSLDNITKEQKTLLSGITPEGQIKTAADTALETLNNNTAKLSAIRQSVAIAASNQDALASLNANVNSVAAFGEISEAHASKITVEQITFGIGSQTIIKDIAGNSLLASALKKGDKVNVVGIKNQSTLVAQQILVTNQQSADSEAGQGQVKPADTANTATSASSSLASIKKPATNATSSAATNTTTLQTDPNKAWGLFMFEDPTPQFGK